MSDPVYFAAKPVNEIVKALGDRVTSYYDWLRDSSRLALWRTSYEQYYSGLIQGGTLQSDGDQDEFIAMNVNDLRNLGRHLVVMATSQRPSFEPRAVNSDHRSQTQTILASGILDYVLKEKGLEAAADEAVESSLIMPDSHIAVDWDAMKGQDVIGDPSSAGPDGAPTRTVKSGDLAFRFYSPIDMVLDYTKSSRDAHQWRIARRWPNRYDLAAREAPGSEAANKILDLPRKADPMRPRYISKKAAGALEKHESDDVELFEFYHDRSDALPDGRKVIFCTGIEEPIFDGPLPYKDLSIYSMSPEPMILAPHGYSPLFDLLSVQQASNSLWSTLASNIAAFGVQNVWAQSGDAVNVSQLTGGLNVIYSRVKPEPLQLTANSADTYKLLELLQKALETLSGVNSVARGNPEASLKSGAALALVQAQAIQFSIGLQKAYVRLMEGVGTGTIRLYQRFATAPQVAMLAGKSNRGYLQEFTASDLDRIDRVAVDIGNPLARTVAGRTQMADTMLERGLIKTPEQYMQVITTGRLDPVVEADQKQMLAIKRENELLSEGQNPPVLLTDNHPAHIREHNGVIASPEARDNPEVAQTTLAHMQEHANQWRTMDPAWAMALGIPPPPMAAPMPGAPMGGPPSTTGPAPMPLGGPSMSGPMPKPVEPAPAMVPPEMAGQMPNMPQMPINPLSGERAPEPPQLA